MNAILVFFEGVLAFLSPCILPLLPVYLAYLAGQESATGDAKSKQVIWNTLAFIAGFTLVFISMGMMASAIGRLLFDYRLLIQRVSGVIIILLGLHYTGLFRLGFLQKDSRRHQPMKQLNLASSFVFGLAFAFGWSPCIGPLLGAALAMAANQDTVLQGMGLLFAFSMGLAVPFFASAMLIDRLKKSFDFIKRHFRVISLISGIFLILIGLAFLFDLFGYWQGLFT